MTFNPSSMFVGFGDLKIRYEDDDNTRYSVVDH